MRCNMTDYEPTTSYLGLFEEFMTWLRSKRWLWVVILLLYLITGYGVYFTDVEPWFAFPYWRYVYAVIAVYGTLYSAWVVLYPPEVDDD
jgi:hypothetical protein